MMRVSIPEPFPALRELRGLCLLRVSRDSLLGLWRFPRVLALKHEDSGEPTADTCSLYLIAVLLEPSINNLFKLSLRESLFVVNSVFLKTYFIFNHNSSDVSYTSIASFARIRILEIRISLARSLKIFQTSGFHCCWKVISFYLFCVGFTGPPDSKELVCLSLGSIF